MNSLTVFYTTKDNIKISKVFPKHRNILSEIQGFIIDIYYEYEYNSQLSIKDISVLLGIEERTAKYEIKKILNKVKTKAINQLG